MIEKDNCFLLRDSVDCRLLPAGWRFSGRCDPKNFFTKQRGAQQREKRWGIDPGPSRPREVERGDGSLAASFARATPAFPSPSSSSSARCYFAPTWNTSNADSRLILLTLPTRNPQRKRLFFLPLGFFPRTFDRLITTSPTFLLFPARSVAWKSQREVSPRDFSIEIVNSFGRLKISETSRRRISMCRQPMGGC